MTAYKTVITPQHPEGIQVPLTDAEITQQQADASYVAPQTPLQLVTSAVKSLPVALRTDADFGTFVSQCLLAIDHVDMESLGYLINNSIAATPDPSYKGFRTSEPAYVQLLTNAKQLFGV